MAVSKYGGFYADFDKRGDEQRVVRDILVCLRYEPGKRQTSQAFLKF